MTRVQEIAMQLHADLKAGKLAKVGIDEINAAIHAEDPNLSYVEFQIVQQKLIRKVEELAG